jgi:gliding motility-associated-like protein
VEGKDNIKDLFGEKLGSFEADVRPELWSNISSQLGNTAGVAGSTSVSVFTKTVIGISIAASVTVASYFLFTDSKREELIPNMTTEATEKELFKEKNIPKKVIVGKNNNVTNASKNVEFNDYLPEIINQNIVSGLFNVNIENVLPPLQVKSNSAPIIATTVIDKSTENAIITADEVVNNYVSETESVSNTVNTTSEEEFSLVLPNVFTPNGDPMNNLFQIDSKGLSDFSIVIIDRNSKILFKSNDASFVWDGTLMNGDFIPEGNYIYYVTARNSKGELISRHATLSVFR